MVWGQGRKAEKLGMLVGSAFRTMAFVAVTVPATGCAAADRGDGEGGGDVTVEAEDALSTSCTSWKTLGAEQAAAMLASAWRPTHGNCTGENDRLESCGRGRRDGSLTFVDGAKICSSATGRVYLPMVRHTAGQSDVRQYARIDVDKEASALNYGMMVGWIRANVFGDPSWRYSSPEYQFQVSCFSDACRMTISNARARVLDRSGNPTSQIRYTDPNSRGARLLDLEWIPCDGAPKTKTEQASRATVMPLGDRCGELDSVPGLAGEAHACVRASERMAIASVESGFSLAPFRGYTCVAQRDSCRDAYGKARLGPVYCDDPPTQPGAGRPPHTR